MRDAFALQSAEASHIFSTKNISIGQILKFEILTNRLLMTSLVLNNQALLFSRQTEETGILIMSLGLACLHEYLCGFLLYLT